MNSDYRKSMRDLCAEPRHCSQCRQMKPRKGGKVLGIENRRERWVCADCAKGQG